MGMAAVDYKEVQGIVRFGYRKLTEASFLLLTIRDIAAARAWLAAAPISDAVACASSPRTAMQVAFTSGGLERLALSPDVLAGFAPEFLVGLTGDSSRSLLLGDVGASAPLHWQWGAPGRVPHLLVMLYAQPNALHDWSAEVQDANFKAAFDLLKCLPTSDLGGVEPFGFPDGVSQPKVDWERSLSTAHEQLAYSNVVSLGEFLLGYPNEYGRYTDRPLLPALDSAAAALPIAEDEPTQRDFGRNGCYLVLRTLEQDVSGFWRFVNEKAAGSAEGREALASAMVGRKLDGTPLAPLAAATIDGIDPATAAQNQFTFDTDTEGTQCPFGAHIRRANPRNADLPTPLAPFFKRQLVRFGLAPKGHGVAALRGDAKASTRFHRILRRGREYGTRVPMEQAIADSSGSGPHGIHFICLAANLVRQFEFLQSSWLMSSKFDAMTDESDPLLGNRQPVAGCCPANAFSRPRQGDLPDRIEGLPQFITVKGGAYFFLPSLPALRYIAALTAESPAPLPGEKIAVNKFETMGKGAQT
jgi:deferrochelatase/peroxidase EfeB